MLGYVSTPTFVTPAFVLRPIEAEGTNFISLVMSLFSHTNLTYKHTSHSFRTFTQVGTGQWAIYYTTYVVPNEF